MAMKDISDAQVCRAVADFRARKLALPWPYEALAAETGQPEKVCLRAMDRAERRGLIECGVSLRTGWLTEKGLALVAVVDRRSNAPRARTDALAPNARRSGILVSPRQRL